MENKLKRILIKNIFPDSGFAHVARTGLHRLSSHQANSPGVIFEDGKPLPGPANSPHEDIRLHGMGRYSFWHDHVYFSSSDNTSPLHNNRDYEIGFPSKSDNVFNRAKAFLARAVKGRHARDEYKPVNLQRRDDSMEKIQGDVEYAGSIGRNYLAWLRENDYTIKNRTILEIGPGINFGSTLLLACFGARVKVADRFLSRWEQHYHRRFYELFRKWIEQNVEQADLSPIDRILAENDYPHGVIECYETPLEELTGISDSSVDYIFSNAVLEHIFHPERSFYQLSRVSKPDAIGYHQVDFRDHHDFSKPLEFLLIPDNKYKDEMVQNHCERGNRKRPAEYKEILINNKFNILEIQPNLFPEEIYLDEFIPRLRNSTISQYRLTNREELMILSARFTVQKI